MALIDKASLLMVPSTYEAGKLYNVLPSGNRAPDSTNQNSGYDQTRADFTFDRGSNASATRIGSDGLIKKYRENILTYSNDFSNAAWSKSNASVTSGQSGYDGSSDAWKLTTNTANSTHYTREVVTTSGITTASIYAKADGYNFLFIFRQGLNKGYYYNLATGELASPYAQGDIDATITSEGNGWYRCTFTFNHSGTGDLTFFIANADGSFVFTGDGTSGILIQNAQVEKSLVATDYLDSTSVTGKAGVLIDLPRIDYSSGAGALLLEPQRTNAVTQSEYLNGISWNGKIGTSFDTNVTTSPEGLSNASLLKEDSSNGSHFAYKDFNLTSGSTYTISIFAKANGVNRNLRFGDGGVGWSSGFNGVFDLTAGTATGGTIEPMGNGWYRCSVTGTTNATTSRLIVYSTLDEATTYQGDGTSGVYLYGFQLEAGSHVSSYIPTHGAAVTRGADSCTGAGDVNTFNSTEGVLYFECKTDNTQVGSISINDGTSSNRITARFRPDINKIQLTVIGSTDDFNLNSDIITISDYNKIAIVYNNGDYYFFVNGIKGNVESKGTFSANTFTQFDFNRGGGGEVFAGNSKQILYFPEALTDAECITLTTL